VEESKPEMINLLAIAWLAFIAKAHAEESKDHAIDNLVHSGSIKLLERAPKSHATSSQVGVDSTLLGKTAHLAMPAPRTKNVMVRANGMDRGSSNAFRDEGAALRGRAPSSNSAVPGQADRGRTAGGVDVGRRAFLAGLATTAALQGRARSDLLEEAGKEASKALEAGKEADILFRAEKQAQLADIKTKEEESSKALISSLLEKSKANKEKNDLDRSARILEVQSNSLLIRSEDIPDKFLQTERLQKQRPAECNLPIISDSEICRKFDGKPSGTTPPPGLEGEVE
jgi:hypothetical protein